MAARFTVTSFYVTLEKVPIMIYSTFVTAELGFNKYADFHFRNPELRNFI